jgi:hypothetical protein
MDFFTVVKPRFLRISGLTRPPVVREVSRIPERQSRQCGLGERRFKIESPTYFLVAAGDFAAIAARMRLDKPANDRASEAEPRDKRSANSAQVAGGERTEGEKGGGYVIVTRDGLRLQIRDNSNLQVRCDQLEFTWRAAEKGLWKHIAGSGTSFRPKRTGRLYKRKERNWSSL